MGGGTPGLEREEEEEEEGEGVEMSGGLHKREILGRRLRWVGVLHVVLV
jgi:hypothetical protein